MGTRSGDIDPAIMEFIAKKEKLDIESTRRTWELITEVLKQLA